MQPWQKQLIPNELAFLKQKNLHELGKRMSREKGWFYRRYPDPDVGGKRSDDAESEYLLEYSVFLEARRGLVEQRLSDSSAVEDEK